MNLEFDDSDLGFETGFDKEGMWNDMVPVTAFQTLSRKLLQAMKCKPSWT